MSGASTIATILASHEDDLINDWVAELRSSAFARDTNLAERARAFVRLLRELTSHTNSTDVTATSFGPLRAMLDETARDRARQGFSARDTATLIFSFKKPLFGHVRSELANDPKRLTEQMLYATELLDALGLHTTDAASRAREEVIQRQQEEMLELSTPVVKLWEGILALPIIGTLDSARTQVVMETLLTRIAETGSSVAIIDITGVPTVDTLTAQHLLKTVTAARLMGADAIISGIRPQIAQTIVHLGVELGDVTTKATLADAFALALRRHGLTLARTGPRSLHAQEGSAPAALMSRGRRSEG